MSPLVKTSSQDLHVPLTGPGATSAGTACSYDVALNTVFFFFLLVCLFIYFFISFSPATLRLCILCHKFNFLLTLSTVIVRPGAGMKMQCLLEGVTQFTFLVPPHCQQGLSGPTGHQQDLAVILPRTEAGAKATGIFFSHRDN